MKREVVVVVGLMVKVVVVVVLVVVVKEGKQVLAVIGKQTKVILVLTVEVVVVVEDVVQEYLLVGVGLGTLGWWELSNSKSTTPTLHLLYMCPSTFKIFIKLLSLIHRKYMLLIFKRKVQEWGRLPLPSQV